MENILVLILLMILLKLLYSKYKTLIFHNHSTTLTEDHYTSSNDKTPLAKGIVFFDIDGTLTNINISEKEDIIQYCLSHGYAVGIMTASSRIPSHICNKDIPLHEWMPETLCSFMKETDYLTFNSSTVVAGMNSSKFKHFDRGYLSQLSIMLSGTTTLVSGIRKGLQMKFIQHITQLPNQHIILIDNDPMYIFGAKCIFPDGIFVCVNSKVDYNVEDIADVYTDSISIPLLSHIIQ